MAAYASLTVQNFQACSQNIFNLRKRTNPLQLFSAKEPLIGIGIDIPWPLAKFSSGRRFYLVITYRFTDLTQAVPLLSIDTFTVTRSFAHNFIFKYGSPEAVLSKMYHSLCWASQVTSLTADLSYGISCSSLSVFYVVLTATCPVILRTLPDAKFQYPA